MGLSILDFPMLADFLHVWGLSVANFLRPMGIDFPPADWSLGSI
ncbi:hypothetical protein [Corynebacterium gallinarum]|nr:hypothetical protein [Corynebacterium gallinarum]